MKPEEKAKELIERFKPICKRFILCHSPFAENKYDKEGTIKAAKQCALIAVEEVLNYQAVLMDILGPDVDGYTPQFYLEVKQAIEK